MRNMILAGAAALALAGPATAFTGIEKPAVVQGPPQILVVSACTQQAAMTVRFNDVFTFVPPPPDLQLAVGRAVAKYREANEEPIILVLVGPSAAH